MILAIPFENNCVFQHFGHTEQFKLYTIEDGKVLSADVVSTNGQGHSLLALFLVKHQVDAVICGGIGGGAQMALSNAGIQVFAGVQGPADEAARAFAEGNLQFDPNARCNHHHEEGHSCGEHGCGEHSCSGSCHA